MRGTPLPVAAGADPPAFVVALHVAAALTRVCGQPVQPEIDQVVLPAPAYPAAATVAAAITAERVTPAGVTPAGAIAVTVRAGYDRAACRQIVLAVAKVWHGLCAVHTPVITALEAGACPLPPAVAAWPWALERAVLDWLAAAGVWTEAGRPGSPALVAALERWRAALLEVEGPRLAQERASYVVSYTTGG